MPRHCDSCGLRKRRTLPLPGSGGPQWIDSQPYDIVAKAEGEVSNQQLFLMIQKLLAIVEQLGMELKAQKTPIEFIVTDSVKQASDNAGLKLNAS